MKQRSGITRRELLRGNGLADRLPLRHHISSAVISVLPRHREQVCVHIDDMEGVEVHAAEGSKIVAVIEGPSAGVLGERLMRINLLEGVLSANLVYEQICDEEESAS
ncbi:hypothetical protein DKP76_16700 [Falsochrobactrum shanghaiense]|uniref:Chaperone NapD n=1 Tax=Falsochrobactrum shanghaiense TaxID=2201899 RepID=A0A316J763_9HYPH|nr:chaperone NapD [Falsochrobactrum shanghaiense]PWL16605.1 hypothetical protein DKP76_16700 [Falsochrobactrum shanghaiense]